MKLRQIYFQEYLTSLGGLLEVVDKDKLERSDHEIGKHQETASRRGSQEQLSLEQTVRADGPSALWFSSVGTSHFERISRLVLVAFLLFFPLKMHNSCPPALYEASDGAEPLEGSLRLCMTFTNPAAKQHSSPVLQKQSQVSHA